MNNELLAAVAEYLISQGSARELAKEKIRAVLDGRMAAPTVSVDLLRNEADRILSEIGVPFNLKGRDILKEAICMVAKDPELGRNITKGLYVDVAKLTGDTPPRVERAMRHAIEAAFDRCNFKACERYFNGTVNPNKGRPTNSEFVNCLAAYVRKKLGMGK